MREKLEYRPVVWAEREELLEKLPPALRSRGFLDQLIEAGVIKPYPRPHRKTPVFDLHESLRAADQVIRNGTDVQRLARQSIRAKELEIQRQHSAAWKETTSQAARSVRAC